jgi:hypothetical protein
MGSSENIMVSQLIIKHTEDTLEYVSEAPNSGI